MPGFRYCSWCNGKGCICCEGEMLRWCKTASGDLRQIRNECYFAGFSTDEKIEAAFKPALDAEYARQFPDGPIPMFTAHVDNPSEMSILKQVFNESIGRSKQSS